MSNSQGWFILSSVYDDAGRYVGFRCLSKRISFLRLDEVKGALREFENVIEDHPDDRVPKTIQDKAFLLTGRDREELLENFSREFKLVYTREYHQVAKNWGSLYPILLPGSLDEWPENPFDLWEGYSITFDFGKFRMMIEESIEIINSEKSLC